MEFMEQAIALAVESVARGGGPFGAVVVREGRVIGRGSNRVVTENDPTAHAEVEAIRDACRRVGSHSLEGAELVSSCEPCPMCLAAIRWARIGRLRFASTREDAAGVGFDDELLHAEFARGEGTAGLEVVREGREAARAAFEAWEEKEDRVRY